MDSWLWAVASLYAVGFLRALYYVFCWLWTEVQRFSVTIALLRAVDYGFPEDCGLRVFCGLWTMGFLRAVDYGFSVGCGLRVF